jgi:hypothetical protein
MRPSSRTELTLEQPALGRESVHTTVCITHKHSLSYVEYTLSSPYSDRVRNMTRRRWRATRRGRRTRSDASPRLARAPTCRAPVADRGCTVLCFSSSAPLPLLAPSSLRLCGFAPSHETCTGQYIGCMTFLDISLVPRYTLLCTSIMLCPTLGLQHQPTTGPNTFRLNYPVRWIALYKGWQTLLGKICK